METFYINLKCKREGTYTSSVGDASNKRSTIKNLCKVEIKASMDINDRKWWISIIASNQNHELSPNKSRHFAIYKCISADTKRRLLINDNVDVQVNNSIKAYIIEVRGL